MTGDFYAIFGAVLLASRSLHEFYSDRRLRPGQEPEQILRRLWLLRMTEEGCFGPKTYRPPKNFSRSDKPS